MQQCRQPGGRVVARWLAGGFPSGVEPRQPGPRPVDGRVEDPGGVIGGIDRGQLVIRGERRDQHTEGRTLSEVRYGAFRRSFKVPAQVTGEAVTASYEAGVLTVRVAGVYAGTEPQRIAITTK